MSNGKQAGVSPLRQAKQTSHCGLPGTTCTHWAVGLPLPRVTQILYSGNRSRRRGCGRSLCSRILRSGCASLCDWQERIPSAQPGQAKLSGCPTALDCQAGGAGLGKGPEQASAAAGHMVLSRKWGESLACPHLPLSLFLGAPNPQVASGTPELFRKTEVEPSCNESRCLGKRLGVRPDCRNAPWQSRQSCGAFRSSCRGGWLYFLIAF